MHTRWKIALAGAIMVLVVAMAASIWLETSALQPAAHHTLAHMGLAAQPVHGGQMPEWIDSRYRCVSCHTHHNHEVVMPHPLGPNCRSCHRGSANKVGCPSCHSIHDVDYPHEVYPTCNDCHAGEEVASPQVQTTAIGYAAYLFDQREFFLSDDSAVQNAD